MKMFNKIKNVANVTLTAITPIVNAATATAVIIEALNHNDVSKPVKIVAYAALGLYDSCCAVNAIKTAKTAHDTYKIMNQVTDALGDFDLESILAEQSKDDEV